MSLEGLLEQLMNMKGVRHAILAIESLDGSLSWRGAKGTDDPEGTPMEFPEDLLKGVHIINGVDYFDRLTIRHLLSHSSGIPDYLELKGKGEGTLIDRVLEDQDMSWTLEDILQIVRNANAPLFPPQDLSNSKYRIRYSDTNFQMLIDTIERVTEKSINDAYKEMLFGPLDLGNTFFPGSKPLGSLGPAASGHTGAVGSWLFYCPKLELIFAGTVGQLTAAAPFKITPRLLKILGK